MKAKKKIKKVCCNCLNYQPEYVGHMTVYDARCLLTGVKVLMRSTCKKWANKYK